MEDFFDEKLRKIMIAYYHFLCHYEEVVRGDLFACYRIFFSGVIGSYDKAKYNTNDAGKSGG